MKVCLVVVTPVAVVAPWPTQTEEVFLACFLGAEFFLKFNEAHLLLLHCNNSFYRNEYFTKVHSLNRIKYYNSWRVKSHARLVPLR